MSRIMEIFQEDNGGFSSQRLVFLAGNLALWSVWTYISLKQGQMQPISPELLLGLGILQAGKVGQKAVENRK